MRYFLEGKNNRDSVGNTILMSAVEDSYYDAVTVLIALVELTLAGTDSHFRVA